jgi:hypothetical protein
MFGITRLVRVIHFQEKNKLNRPHARAMTFDAWCP